MVRCIPAECVARAAISGAGSTTRVLPSEQLTLLYGLFNTLVVKQKRMFADQQANTLTRMTHSQEFSVVCLRKDHGDHLAG